MGHPEIDNLTGFAAELMFLSDEEQRPLAVQIVKGTFCIAQACCVRAEEQVPVQLEGECWGEDSATSSYKYEPETAFFKAATDVVLVGHAYAPRAQATFVDVELRVGPLHKALRVFGDRAWVRSLGAIVTSAPQPFERIPLVYERAFGGCDPGEPDRDRCQRDMRNPVGTGFALQLPEAGLRLPNLEDPRALLSKFGDRPTPMGVGFVSPHWQERVAYAGTYDDRWLAERAPLLPRDFDRRFFSAASSGLTAAGYLRGTEPVHARGVTDNQILTFALPGVAPPRITLARAGASDVQLESVLDTVIIEPDAQRVQLLWRAHTTLRSGPHDVRGVQIRAAA